jgi:hypothetical protein
MAGVGWAKAKASSRAVSLELKHSVAWYIGMVAKLWVATMLLDTVSKQQLQLMKLIV